MEARATKGEWHVHRSSARGIDRLRRFVSVPERGVAVVHGLDEYKETPLDNEADANADLIATLRNLALPFADLWAAAEKRSELMHELNTPASLQVRVRSREEIKMALDLNWGTIAHTLARLKEMKQ